MHRLNIFSNFGFNLDLSTEVPCELYFDSIPLTEKKSVRILCVLEPNEISGFRKIAISNYEKFDLILTFDEEILSSCINSKLFLHGTTWVKNFNFTQEKEYCITTLVGGKSTLTGHKLRQSFVNESLVIKNIPVHVFNSSNQPFLRSSEYRRINDRYLKNELFYSQFHIAIENNISKNYFTEKLIDCFQTKTIPIYFGCSNIQEFFDTRGIFIVKNLEELIKACQSIDEQTYGKMISYVESNYETSMKYSNIHDRLTQEINSFLNQK